MAVSFQHHQPALHQSGTQHSEYRSWQRAWRTALHSCTLPMILSPGTFFLYFLQQQYVVRPQCGCVSVPCLWLLVAQRVSVSGIRVFA
jgi:hypothetical protein